MRASMGNCAMRVRRGTIRVGAVVGGDHADEVAGHYGRHLQDGDGRGRHEEVIGRVPGGAEKVGAGDHGVRGEDQGALSFEHEQ